MDVLAQAWTGGPGPWVFLFPLFWVVVVGGVVFLLRTAGRRRGVGPFRRGCAGGPAAADHSPVTVLGRRFAAGEIDEDEYWRRLSVLEERFGAKG
ncbi:SHOCT domain-containing protein [Streptomyces sp. NPDC059740]|uniref:SHOCT domain-containing protein n=1 Tax=Streptomyces sp. NPDC059740 TaxID=3346926 RepID=UPI00365E0BA2